jgi:hypothetical protein
MGWSFLLSVTDLLLKTFEMKLSELKTKMLLTGATLFFLFLSVTSNAQKLKFLTSTVVPEARGSIKIDKDKNNNYAIDINIMHLADPSRLTPSKKTYVVWLETQDSGTKNIGLLNSSSGLLSNTMKAALHVVTPFKARRVFITAENDGRILYPGSVVVLTTESF